MHSEEEFIEEGDMEDAEPTDNQELFEMQLDPETEHIKERDRDSDRRILLPLLMHTF